LRKVDVRNAVSRLEEDRAVWENYRLEVGEQRTVFFAGEREEETVAFGARTAV
jgi:hypothetical protein